VPVRKQPAATIKVLVALLLGAGFALAFGVLAREVVEGDTTGFDRAVLLALRKSGHVADPVGPAWLLEMARDITALGSYSILGVIVFASVGYLLIAGKGRAALLVLVAVVGGVLLSNGLKIGFARPRPDIVPQLAKVFTSSFPSGHATLSAVVYLTLGSLLTQMEDEARRIKFYFLGLAVFLTLIVGISRVYLGVHYPTDVLAGWCIGSAWALACWALALYLQREGAIERPEQHSPLRLKD
jgi:undecaprenyl-diphosphatase